MSAYSWPAQKAVFAAIGSLAGGRVHVDAPADVTFPWIELAHAQIIPDDTVADGGGSDSGVSDFFDLHVWSREPGDEEVLTMIDSIHTALHGITLTIEGRTSGNTWVRTARILRDPDGSTRHGVVSVEVIHRSN